MMSQPRLLLGAPAALSHDARMRSARSILAFSFSFSLGLAACGDDSGPHVTPPECETIAETCHPVDPGSGPIHECHENAELVWTAAECTADTAGCIALCTGAAQDAGPADAPASDAPTAD
jgi:hypothetical protein